MSDHRLVKWLLIIVLIPVGMAMCSGDGEHFRYPCQNPANWDKDICKMPLCDVTRTCPELIFKGHDPKTGLSTTAPAPQITPAPTGVNCK